MPIFEYRCGKCGKIYEELIFGDRDRKVPCPACGSDNSEKIPSVIGAIATAAPSTPYCGAACAGVPSCPASGGSCCPHAH
jgi:putative FmdB family regulatory protein